MARVQSSTTNFSCNTLVGSGCQEIVILKKYAEKLKMKIEKSSLNAELWDRTLVPLERCCENLNIRIGEATINVRPYIVDWIAYDLILGKAWLSEANSIINWKDNRMLLKEGSRLIALDAKAPQHGESHPTFILASKQFMRLAKKQKSVIYHVVLKNREENEKERTGEGLEALKMKSKKV